MQPNSPDNCPNCKSILSLDSEEKPDYIYKCNTNCLVKYSYYKCFINQKFMDDDQVEFIYDSSEYIIRNEYQSEYLFIQIDLKPLYFYDIYLDFSKSKEEIIQQVKLLLTFQ